MTTSCPSPTQTTRTANAQALLREIGYVLWLSRRLAVEIQAEKSQPVRPEMAEFCAVEMATCAA
ncbi:MAG TPA: hypothetical protein VL371_00835 [Gemmataceae bacterium]|jgi:hypothetical protein|nr:hypothetical protein [Gemmataceae bacterium]